MPTGQFDEGSPLTEIANSQVRLGLYQIDTCNPHINPSVQTHPIMSLYRHIRIHVDPDISNQSSSFKGRQLLLNALRAAIRPLGIQVPCVFWAVHSASQTESHSFRSDPWEKEGLSPST